MFSPLDKIIVSKKSNPDVHMAMEYAKDFYDRKYSSLFLRSGLMIHTLADYQKSIEKLYALFDAYWVSQFNGNNHLRHDDLKQGIELFNRLLIVCQCMNH